MAYGPDPEYILFSFVTEFGDNNNNNNKNIYLPPKNMSTVMLGTGDYMYSNSGNTKVIILKLADN